MKIRICIFIAIVILVIFGVVLYVKGNKINDNSSRVTSTTTSNSSSSSLFETGQNTENLNNDVVFDIEENEKHYVTDDGAVVWVYKTVSDEVIRGCDQFIIDNKCDLNGIEFIFLNSLYTFSPQYVLDNLIDYYSDFQSDNQYDTKDVYFVQEIYKDTVLGFLVIDSNGKVINTYNIQSSDGIKDIDFNTNISDIDANRIAIEAVDSNNSNIISCVKFVDYQNDNNTICYRVKFNDNSCTIIDASTGAIIRKQ